MTTPIASAPSQPPVEGTIPATAQIRSVNLTGPAGRLEALLNAGSADAPYSALICHPHPKGGGTMHNKVVYHAMKVVNDAAWGLQWPALRFNFRGTGMSQGAHDGVAETGDVLAAIKWLENEYKRPVVAMGFSFGAAMTLMACCGGNVRALVALGLPTHAEGRDYRYRFLAHCTVAKIFLSGDCDQFAPAAQLAQVVAAAAEPKRLVLLPGADHFFTDHVERMQQALRGCLQDWLQENLQ